MASEKKPWDQLEGEPQKWFDRFDTFRLMGPTRAIEDVWKAEAKVIKGKRPSPNWYKCKERYRWDERVRAWDDAERPRRRAEKMKKIAEAQGRHVQYGQFNQGKAMQKIQKIVPDDLEPMEALAMLKQGVALEIDSLVGPLTVDLQEQLDEVKAQITEMLNAQPE